MSESDNAVIQRRTDLESDAGDTIDFDLSVQLRQKPTAGDARLQGKEENLRFFSDQVRIDQLRHGVSAGSKMSRKRTVHNIRKIGKDRLSDYWFKTSSTSSTCRAPAASTKTSPRSSRMWASPAMPSTRPTLRT